MFNLNNDSTKLDAIRNYQKMGFALFPLIPKNKEPLTKNGHLNATNNLDDLERWWDRYPEANIGIATGEPSGFWILDVDGEQGEASLKELESEYGSLPPTVEAITGRTNGGRHLYFAMPESIDIRNSTSKIAPKLDIRADGGYTIVPPSIHPTGKKYKWSNSGADKIANAPKWLIELIQKPKTKNSVLDQSDWKELVSGVPEGGRNDALTRISGALLGSNLDPDTALELCFSWNDSRCDPPLDTEEVIKTFESIQKREAEKQAALVDETEMVCLDDIEMEPINWLWDKRIALGKLNLIAGQPGLGKSQITANIATHVTTGRPWPDAENELKVGSVVFLSDEDDPADTIKPRLVAAGANIKKCHVLKFVKQKDENGNENPRGFDLKQDVEKLKETCRALGDVRLIVIDPISAYMGKTDSNNNSEVRGLLSPLTDFAVESGIAILVVTHFNKSSNQDAVNKVIGSMGLIAAARSGFAVVKDQDDHELRYFVPIKNNIGNDSSGFSFEIESVDLGDGIHTSKIVWGDEVNAQDILYPEKKDKAPYKNSVEKFLWELIVKSRKPVESKEVLRLGEEAGFSEGQLNTAKKKLRIQSRKLDFDNGPWVWHYFDLEDADLKNLKSSTSSLSSSFEIVK